MKYLLLLSTLLISLFISNKADSQIIPKNHWESFTTSDGLIGDDVQDVLIEDLSNIWIATDMGLSHFDGSTFTNYNTANSTLLNNDIRELVLTQNRVWMRTPTGLSSFDGVAFTNYTTANGLLDNLIKDIAHTSNDTLWMCSSGGVSKFDGTSFTHYASTSANIIEVDDSNRVYAGQVFGVPNANLVSLYENGTWSNPTPTGLPVNISVLGRELKRTKDGNLYCTNFGDNEYYEISYPLHYELKKVELETPGSSFLNDINLSIIDRIGGKLWAGCSNPRFMCSTRDTIARFYRINNLNLRSTSIDLSQNLVVVGTSEGIYIADNSIEPSNDRAEEFSVNQIKTSVSITDPLFSDVFNNVANFEYPKNSGNHGLYTANFIVAAKKVNQTSNTVHPTNAFFPSFAPGPISNTSGLNGDFLVKVSKQEILAHQANFNQPSYTTPEGIANWLAYGDTTLGISKDLAPFVDANSNGCYDPESGDYPIIKGDEAIYWINHPDDKTLELEYHWMMYAYDAPNNELDQTVFVQYTIVNRAVTVYDSVKVGFYFDADLGSSNDDYVGCDSLNDIMYAYNGSLTDPGQGGSPGYGRNTPALGVKFLSDPMSNLMYFNIGNGVTGDPVTNQDWTNFMNSKWKNGQQLRYGGNGYNSQGVSMSNTTHMFTGDPYLQTGWTELTPGGGQAANPSGDRRVFGSMPYFSLQPNERKTIEIVVGYGMTTDTAITQLGENISPMIDVLKYADSSWNTITVPTANFASTDSCKNLTSLSFLQIEEERLKVFPVPTSQNLTIESNDIIEEVQLFDMKGALTFRELHNQIKVNLNLESFEEGIYMLRVRKANDVWETKKVILMQ